MLTTLMVISLAATPAPIKTLATPGLTCSNVDPKLADSFLLHFTQQLSIQGGIQVITPAEVQALIGMSRQKQLLGCSDDSCNAEIAAALGVDGIITGNLAKTSSGYLINIKISRTAGEVATLGVFAARPKTDDELLDFLEASARKFAAGLGLKKQGEVVGAKEPVAVATVPQTPPRIWPWVTGGAAVAAAGAGVALLVMSQGTAATLRKGGADPTVPTDLNPLKSAGQTQETLGYTFVGVAGALAVTTVVLAIVGAPANSPSVAVVPTREGGSVVLGGSF